MKIEIVNENNHIGWTDLYAGDVYEYENCHYLVISNGPGSLSAVNLQSFKVDLLHYSDARPILKSATLRITNVVAEVDDNDEWEEVKVDSSFIEEIAYLPSLERMTIRMNGIDYLYVDVPLVVWKEFKGAPSKGEYYNSCIKGQYEQF